MTEAPERITFSIPPNSELSADDIDAAVKDGNYRNRSQAIRDLIRDGLNG